VFPEKESEPGSIYIEAADKVTLKKIRDITFVNANEVLGIIYKSKSGHSMLKWRHIEHEMGRVTGDASNNSLVNLSMARIITPEYVEELVNRAEMDSGGSRESTPYSPTPPEAAPREQQPIAEGSSSSFSADEGEEDFGAAGSSEGGQEDLEGQQREETV